jgi:hypothetical protein
MASPVIREQRTVAKGPTSGKMNNKLPTPDVLQRACINITRVKTFTEGQNDFNSYVMIMQAKYLFGTHRTPFLHKISHKVTMGKQAVITKTYCKRSPGCILPPKP